MYYMHEFMGHTYEVVNGSRRHKLLLDAVMAAHHGCKKASIDFHLESLRAPGCAHEHRLGVRHG